MSDWLSQHEDAIELGNRLLDELDHHATMAEYQRCWEEWIDGEQGD